MSPLLIDSHSPGDTLALGARLGAAALPGMVVGLSGDLGAGKTTLTKGVARGLGADPDGVTSPTFTFLHVYGGRIPIYHLDLYRLETADQVRDLGVDDFLGGDGLALVEWFENVPGVLPETRVEMRLTVTGETSRRIEIVAFGEGWENFLRSLKA